MGLLLLEGSKARILKDETEGVVWVELHESEN